MRKTLLYYEQNVENFIRETREVDTRAFFEQAGKGCFDFRFWLWFGA